MITEAVLDNIVTDPLFKLTTDLKASAKLLGRSEARFLVDFYYMLQDNRIRSDAQVRAHTESAEPNKLLVWCADNFRVFENTIKSALNVFTKEYTVGRWAQSICGVGPVITAGLMAHLDISKAQDACHFWRFAGLDPNIKWLGKAGAAALLGKIEDEEDDTGDGDQFAMTPEQVKELDETLAKSPNSIRREHLLRVCQLTNRKLSNILRLAKNDDGAITRASVLSLLAKRPWNAQLKCLCAFKLGESFVKVQNRDSDFYGKLYVRRKERESMMNLDRKFKDQADRQLAEKKIGKNTECYKHLMAGMLPPAQIHARARRYAVKLFLAHLHSVMFEDFHGFKSKIPYAFEKLQHDKEHWMPPPNWPLPEDERRKGLREMK